MSHKPLPPLVQAFVVCREMMESSHSKDLYLVAPFSRVTGPSFPAEKVSMAVYAHLTNARGRYVMTFHLTDDDDDVVWRWDRNMVIEEADPLRPQTITIDQIRVDFPRPGRYDLIMTANGEDLARHALWARLAGTP